MKRLLTTVAILSTMTAPMAAVAQERHEDRDGRLAAEPHAAPAPPAARAPQGPSAAARPQGAAPIQRPDFPGGQGGYRPQPGQYGYRQGGYTQPGAPVPGAAQGRPAYQGQGNYQPQGGYPAQGGNRAQAGFQAQSGYQPQGGFRQQGGGYRPGGRPGGVAFNYGGRSFYRYQAAPYAFPAAYRGWDHHYWRRGEFLPSLFFLPNYYINDWYDFGLWEPDYGYQWIRVGYDALLINLGTGEVVDSVPGVYYY